MVAATPLPGVYDDTSSVAASAVVGSSEPIGGPGYAMQAASQARARRRGRGPGRTCLASRPPRPRTPGAA